MATGLLFVTALAAMLGSARGQTTATDATRVAGSSGTDVVNAVVDLIRSNCIFSEDRLLLRRLAYVESLDGTDPKTYRSGYNGGIWQVDEDKLNATVKCTSVLRSYCNIISGRPFNIDWTKVTWSDLRKPLYSGLAAALYLLQRLGGNVTAIPGDVQGQADLWSHYYHLGVPLGDFSSVANQSTSYSCETPMDIAFVIDSSGSIINSDFLLSLEFVARVVESLDVPRTVRVAALIFADTYVTKFNFNTYSNKSQVAAAIRTMTRTTGGTYTHLALDAARTQFFSSGNTAKRLVILITDGQSSSTALTAAAAQRLKNQGITVFAIGVGGYDLTELRAVASEPVCSYVYTMGQFSIINSILDEIKRSTCRAQIGFTTHVGVASNVTLNSTEPVTFGITNSTDSAMLAFQVNCGILDVYVSYTNPHPSSAMYEEKYTAQIGRPAYLTTSSTYNGQTVYITVVGTRLPSSEAELQKCSEYSAVVSVVDKAVTWRVRCCISDNCRDCTSADILQHPELLTETCDTHALDYTNPCTPEALLAGHLLFAYPYDTSKFIRCDYHGEAYLTLCPSGKRFNPTSFTCGYTVTSDTYRVPLPSSYPNPCTPEKIAAQYLYFEYTVDRQLFIHCDLWGSAWLQTCPAQEMWSQELLTCVVDRPIVAVTKVPDNIVNPCTSEELAAGRFFHPYPCDHTRYIHCDVTGHYWVQYCPVGLFYHPDVFVCVTGDVQTHAGCDE